MLIYPIHQCKILPFFITNWIGYFTASLKKTKKVLLLFCRKYNALYLFCVLENFLIFSFIEGVQNISAYSPRQKGADSDTKVIKEHWDELEVKPDSVVHKTCRLVYTNAKSIEFLSDKERRGCHKTMASAKFRQYI